MSPSLEDILTPQVVIPFVVGFGTVVIGAAVLLLIRGSYRKSVSRALSAIMQEKEATKALLSGLVEMQYRLSDDTGVARRAEFIANKETTDRAALGDLKTRAEIIVDELDAIPAPKRLVPLAERVADIAYLAEEGLGRALDSKSGEEAYASFLDIEGSQLMHQLEAAERDLNDLAVYYGITEVAIYKGGLYV